MGPTHSSLITAVQTPPLGQSARTIGPLSHCGGSASAGADAIKPAAAQAAAPAQTRSGSSRLQRYALERQQHSGIPEDVRLHIRQVEEFGDTGVVGTAHLLVHLRGHGRALDLLEAVAGKELDFEREHEDPLEV